MSDQEKTYDKIESCLFKGKDESSLALTARELEIKNRMMLCVTKKIDNPLIEDAELVNYLTSGCGGQAAKVSRSQAYRDISMVNRLVGNIQLAAKNWYRYLVVEGAKKAFAIAVEKEDAKGAAAALDKLGKYTRSDKEDDRFDFGKMIPPSFEPSDDVTLLEGVKPIVNLDVRRKELRRMLRGHVLEDAEDVSYEE